MSPRNLRIDLAFLLVAILTACTNQSPGNEPAPLSKPEPISANVEISHVPEVVYTSVQGAYIDPQNPPDNALRKRQQLTWLFHRVFHAPVNALRIQNVDVDFTRNGEVKWRESYPRSYLKNLTWLQGGIRYDTDYFMQNIQFIDNKMVSVEKSTTPDVPAGGTVTWARFSEAQPYFGRIDAIKFRFEFRDGNDQPQYAEHTVPVTEWNQKVELHLPFDGLWVAKNGNDLSSGHRNTGLNGLTTYGWDFMKVGEDGRTFKTDGSTPADYYTYGSEVLAPANGTVVYVRDDIEEYGIGITPPRERLEEDGDVFSGNLVIIDAGNREYLLICHMREGTVTVQVGDQVTAGQVIGHAGNSGASMVPHIHMNMMDRKQWLEARGVPSLLSDFERVQYTEAPELIELGNPMTGWLVRPHIAE